MIDTNEQPNILGQEYCENCQENIGVPHDCDCNYCAGISEEPKKKETST